MIRPRLISLCAALLLGTPPAGLAQQAAPRVVAQGTAATVSGTDRIAVVAAIAAALQASYVFPDKVPDMVAKLQAALASGRYDIDDAAAFADAVTQDLREASGDRHAYLLFDPPQFAAATGPDAAKPAAGLDAYAEHLARRDHHGLTEQRILPGNLRYLKITGFEWIDDETGALYDAALQFLRDGDAVIIDLRGNGGGSHGAVRYLVSHFLPPGTLELTFERRDAQPEQSHTLDYLPAGRLTGKPLYVLIDNRVGSAAEAFAYDVQQFHLGELIGVTTAGAANNNSFVPIAPGFMLSISFGRPVHAVSQTNWEGVGVAPDVETKPSEALDAAQLRALDRLAAAPDATPEARADWAWARVAVEARLHPPALTTEQLRTLSGHYGKGEVVLRDTALWLIWPGFPDDRLVPLTADGLFASTGSDMLRVRLTGDRLELLFADQPAPRIYPRS